MAEQLSTIAVPATRVGGYSPLSALNAAQKNVDLDRKRRDEEAAERDAAAVGQVMSQHPEDPDTAIKVLKQTGFHGAAAALQKRVTEERTKMVELRGKEAENEFKLGQISAQQAEAEHKALTRNREEDWAGLYLVNPAKAMEMAPFMLGSAKFIEWKDKQEAARVAAENATRDDERAAAQAAEAARHNTATEGLTLSGQQNAAAIAAANRAAADARAAAALQAQKERAAAGTGPGGAKLSPAQEKEIQIANDALGLITEAETIGTEIGWKGIGAGQGTALGLLASVGYGTEKEEQLRNAVGNMRGTIAALRAGLTMTAQEKAMLDTYVPNINDGDAKTIAKMKSLRAFLERKKINIVNAASGVYAEAPNTRNGGTRVGAFVVEEE